MVLRRCRALLKDEEAAVDAMQDTFVRLLRYSTTLNEEAPSSLIYRMATNVCLNRIRSQSRNKEVCDRDLFENIAAMDEPENRLLASNLLNRLFAKQQTSTRTIAVLHFLDGMTLEEVASEVGMSVSGVRKRLRPLRSGLEGLLE
jgi:RNA polymerase sigma-70 factor (ECF subfamily)